MNLTIVHNYKEQSSLNMYIINTSQSYTHNCIEKLRNKIPYFFSFFLATNRQKSNSRLHCVTFKPRKEHSVDLILLPLAVRMSIKLPLATYWFH